MQSGKKDKKIGEKNRIESGWCYWVGSRGATGRFSGVLLAVAQPSIASAATGLASFSAQCLNFFGQPPHPHPQLY